MVLRISKMLIIIVTICLFTQANENTPEIRFGGGWALLGNGDYNAGRGWVEYVKYFNKFIFFAPQIGFIMSNSKTNFGATEITTDSTLPPISMTAGKNVVYQSSGILLELGGGFNFLSLNKIKLGLIVGPSIRYFSETFPEEVYSSLDSKNNHSFYANYSQIAGFHIGFTGGIQTNFLIKRMLIGSRCTFGHYNKGTPILTIGLDIGYKI